MAEIIHGRTLIIKKETKGKKEGREKIE